MDESSIRSNEPRNSYQVDISNAQSHLDVDEPLIRRVVSATLHHEGIESATISIAVVDNREIHRLNVQYLNHDYATDVLSFLLNSYGNEQTSDLERSQDEKRFIDGEVVVSAEMANQRCAEFLWSPQDELVLYLVHGLLHLCGHDDLTSHEKETMQQHERQILEILGIEIPKDKDCEITQSDSVTGADF